jgi:predicted nucleic acid-binding Zn ribbon protein
MITYFDDPTESYPEHECRVCGKPIEKDGYCSQDCLRADYL